jgi:polyvinyl alcohol dehydrogenase (cytochrome)
MIFAPQRRLFVRSVLVVASALVWAAAATAAPVNAAPPDDQWIMGGHDYRNTRSNPLEQILNPSTVDDLAAKWTTTTRGDVSATPAVVNGAVYFPDWGGFFSKVDARTGRVVWSRQVADYVGIAGAVSRSSPAVVGRTVYIGTQQGARLLAIDTETGRLRWSAQLDPHPRAILTQSPIVFNGVVYQGVSSDEETAAIDPTYRCCTFRGSLTAVNAATGRIIWKSFTLPDQGDSTDIFSGAAIWGGTPAIDPQSRTVYVTTGNNYEVPSSVVECQNSGGTAEECLPPWNLIDSILAFDLRTGALKWRTGQAVFDAWNRACVPGRPPNNCPPNAGPDHDFGDGPHLLSIRGADGSPRKVVGAGQKSGEYWLLDAATGEVLWSAAAGPGSALGGIEWGTATDGRRIYFTETNWDRVPYQMPNGETINYSSFGALDAATGRILWQVPEPHQGIAMAAVSTANGVVFAGSLNGHMYALDAATGEVRWQMQGEGASNAGPAIVNGVVYWGNGYARNGFGAASTTFYALHTPRH